MLPRLKRFADVLAGERRRGRALLGWSLRRMLAGQHRYRRDTALEVWAFAEIYQQWLFERRVDAGGMSEANGDGARFELLLHDDAAGDLDGQVASFLGDLPPPQRLVLLLVYGEGLDFDEAGRVIEMSPHVVAARLIRSSVSLAERLSGCRLETVDPEAAFGVAS
jgi:RNA polymerase sigma-70 factor (ECF subfamily)